MLSLHPVSTTCYREIGRSTVLQYPWFGLRVMANPNGTQVSGKDCTYHSQARVMPFGLRNAPAASQRLMHEVLSDLNPADWSDFVSEYVDDILVYSRSLSDHLHNKSLLAWRNTILRLSQLSVSLSNMESFLGRVLTPLELKTSEDHVSSVKETCALFHGFFFLRDV